MATHKIIGRLKHYNKIVEPDYIEHVIRLGEIASLSLEPTDKRLEYIFYHLRTNEPPHIDVPIFTRPFYYRQPVGEKRPDWFDALNNDYEDIVIRFTIGGFIDDHVELGNIRQHREARLVIDRIS